MVDIELFLSNGLNVSRETFNRLEHYVNRVIESQENLNLIGSSTISTIWERHVLDSAQLISYLPDQPSRIVDFGSGAGFPGIVIALLTQHSVICIESVQKKANFLESICAELSLSCIVLNQRIEDLDPLKADVITARAVAPLTQLIELTKGHLLPEGFFLFPKGEKYAEELKKTRERWLFDCEEYASITNEKSRILRISKVTSKRRGKT